MAYNVIADLGEYTTSYTVNNKCNILTMDNEIMLCEDIQLNNYINGSTILTLSSSSMFPSSDLYIPCGLTEITNNTSTHSLNLIKIDTLGNLSLLTSVSNGILHLNGICFHVNDRYYNHTIGNVNVIPSSPYGAR